MKNILFRYFFILSIFAVGISSCEKKALDVPSFRAGGEGARVRFFNTAFNINDANGGAMFLNIFANGKKINGNQTLSYGFERGSFPNHFIGYAILPAGNTEFSYNRAIYGIQRSGKTDSIQYTDSVFFKNNFNFESSKFYSVFLLDSVSNLSHLVVNDNFSYANIDTFAKVRFLNLATRNGTKNDTFELVRKRDNVNTVLLSNATFGKPTDYVPIAIKPAGIADSFFLRRIRTTLNFPGLTSIIGTNTIAKGVSTTFYVTGSTSRNVTILNRYQH